MGTFDDSTMLGQAMAARSNARDWETNARQWQEYAARLEAQLKTSNANLEAMRALKDAAIQELAKVDPRNYLNVQANRQKIIHDTYTREINNGGKRAA